VETNSCVYENPCDEGSWDLEGVCWLPEHLEATFGTTNCTEFDANFTQYDEFMGCRCEEGMHFVYN